MITMTRIRHASCRLASFYLCVERARRKSTCGAIVDVSSCHAITPDLAHRLRARDITVNGLAARRSRAPGLDPERRS
jgi:hypothetical protein